jgi:hypothetical protein
VPHQLVRALTHAENIRELAGLKVGNNLGADHALVIARFVGDLAVSPPLAYAVLIATLCLFEDDR